MWNRGFLKYRQILVMMSTVALCPFISHEYEKMANRHFMNDWQHECGET